MGTHCYAFIWQKLTIWEVMSNTECHHVRSWSDLLIFQAIFYAYHFLNSPRCTHTVACDVISFVFTLDDGLLSVYMPVYHICVIHSPIRDHFASLHSLTTACLATVSTGGQIFLWDLLSSSFDYYQFEISGSSSSGMSTFFYLREFCTPRLYSHQ